MKGETGRIEELGFFPPARGHLMEVMFGNLLLGEKGRESFAMQVWTYF